jgi:Cu2+-exporting ATPase
MNFKIAHELPGRIRLRPTHRAFTEEALIVFIQKIESMQDVNSVRGSSVTGSILIFFTDEPAARDRILRLAAPDSYPKKAALTIVLDRPWIDRPAAKSLIISVLALLTQFTVPVPWRPVILLLGCWPTLKKGIGALTSIKIDSALLDATAITAAIFIKDYTAAGIITVLLQIGDMLDSETRMRTLHEQRVHFPSGPEWTWLRRDDQTLRLPTSDLQPGDHVIVHAGSAIPIDGFVQEGEALVQETSLTGNAQGQSKQTGDKVFAGTIVEQGELIISVSAPAADTKAAQIEHIIQTAWQRMGKHESLAKRYSDRLALPVLAMSGLTYVLTGSVHRAVAVLLVDVSCALKLSVPLAINHALSVALRGSIVIKGGKAIEALAQADTFVLDKTGTLTAAQPKVNFIKTYHGYDKDFVLRQSACLEEHFPHPMANAVVKEAERRHLEHKEAHGHVTLKIAKGLESELFGERILVGSRKLLEESGDIDFGECLNDEKSSAQQGIQLLYVALGSRVIGLIGLENSIRSDAPAFINQLKASGVRKLILLTGDGIESARRVGVQLGIADVIATASPDEKYQYIERLRRESKSICMVGDGINDSPALLLADVGVALNDGADLAKECADIIVLDNRLASILQARSLSHKVMARVRSNLFTIASVNGSLIVLGAAGLISPVLAALCHNLTTIGVTLNAVRPYSQQN